MKGERPRCYFRAVGLFDGNKKEQHRALLDEARRLLESLRSPEARERIAVEFLEPIGRAAVNLEAHVESTEASELGKGRVMQELAEDVRLLAILTGDTIHQDTRRRFRTMYFDSAVERLAGLEESARTSRTPLFSNESSLEDAIGPVETALRWFADLPSPQSQKYSADQARTIVTLSKQTLADLRERLAPRRPANAPTTRDCPGCRRSNDADAKFCESCGVPLGSRTCSCGAVSSPEATFCKGCGQRFATKAE